MLFLGYPCVYADEHDIVHEICCLGMQMLMASSSDTSFPSDLPVPEDDGLYDHLQKDFEVPTDISLPVATEPSSKVTLADLPGLTILFLYPRTGMQYHTRGDAEIC